MSRLNVVESLPLDLRFWNCSNCGTKNIDRDVNAARNIRDEGLRILLPRTWRGNLAVQRTREFDLWNGG
jgi:transposase